MSWDSLKIKIYEKWKVHWFAIHPPDVAEYSWNYLFTGGKQIRAHLFCELWHYLSPDSEVCAELAFAIECIHVASLVLDDTPWMDNASERRGRTTLHKYLTPKKALLIVYELAVMVRQMWKENKPSFISEEDWQSLARDKLQRLAIGQAYDLEKRGNLYELASLKTGVLFELVTETVAVCIGLDRDFWKIWGNNLGILFQWMDDWCDRDEDLLQGNRNAFNEAHDLTLANYSFLWSRIEESIGAQWFERPFGNYLRQYFTGKLPLLTGHSLKTATLENKLDFSYLKNVSVPEEFHYDFQNNELDDILKKKGVITSYNAKELLKRLYRLSEQSYTLPILQTNLWYVDEELWQDLEEINSFLSKF